MGQADYYDDYWAPGESYPAAIYKEELYALLERAVSPTADCLDFGCGDGSTAGRWLSERGRSYVGVDVSSAAVQEAQARGLDAREVPESGELPFDDESFDLVLATEVLEHLFRPDEACREIRRVLRPGGSLAITVPNVAYWRRRVDLGFFARWNPLGDEHSVEQPWRDPHVRFFTLAALRRMLSASGYEVVHAGAVGGALVKEIPGVRRLARRRSSAVYRFCERLAPSLLGFRLQAIARKP